MQNTASRLAERRAQFFKPAHPIALNKDMDGTQVPEPGALDTHPVAEQRASYELKGVDQGLASAGLGVINHLTNRMPHLVMGSLADFSTPQFVSCAASTELMTLNTRTSALVRYEPFEQWVQTTGFDGKAARELVQSFGDHIEFLPASDQTERKVTFIFQQSASNAAVEDMKGQLIDQHGETAQIMFVETKDRGIVADITPIGCSKANSAAFIMKHLGIPFGNAVGAGNANNDNSNVLLPDPTLDEKLHAGTLTAQDVSKFIGPSNLSESLNKVVMDTRTRIGRDDCHIVAEAPNARGIIQGYRHFGLVQ